MTSVFVHLLQMFWRFSHACSYDPLVSESKTCVMVHWDCKVSQQLCVCSQSVFVFGTVPAFLRLVKSCQSWHIMYPDTPATGAAGSSGEFKLQGAGGPLPVSSMTKGSVPSATSREHMPPSSTWRFTLQMTTYPMVPSSLLPKPYVSPKGSMELFWHTLLFLHFLRNDSSWF